MRGLCQDVQGVCPLARCPGIPVVKPVSHEIPGAGRSKHESRQRAVAGQCGCEGSVRGTGVDRNGFEHLRAGGGGEH
jgi:hypothetical protein